MSKLLLEYTKYKFTRVSLSVRTGGGVSRYQYKEVARASLSVQCTDNEVCTDNICTDSASDKGVSLSVLFRK